MEVIESIVVPYDEKSVRFKAKLKLCLEPATRWEPEYFSVEITDFIELEVLGSGNILTEDRDIEKWLVNNTWRPFDELEEKVANKYYEEVWNN